MEQRFIVDEKNSFSSVNNTFLNVKIKDIFTLENKSEFQVALLNSWINPCLKPTPSAGFSFMSANTFLLLLKPL